MFEGRLIISTVMLSIFAAAVAIAFLAFAPGARMLPLVVGIPGVILAAIQLSIELRRGDAAAGQREDTIMVLPDVRRGELRMFTWFAVFVAGILAFGFIYSSPLLIAAYLLIAGKERWYTALLSAVLVWAILKYVFEHFVGVVLFEGLIPPTFIS